MLDHLRAELNGEPLEATITGREFVRQLSRLEKPFLVGFRKPHLCFRFPAPMLEHYPSDLSAVAGRAEASACVVHGRLG